MSLNDTEMNGTENPLARSAFFSVFPENELARLSRVSSVRKFRKNTQLMLAGDDSQATYVIVHGRVSAYTSDEAGNEFIINTFSDGECFGELGVLDERQRTASVITLTDTECVVVPRSELHRSISAEPSVAMAIIRNLVDRIRNMTEDVSCLALMDVYGRIARVLKAEARLAPDGRQITDRLTHQDLANRVGASREMVSKILKDLKKGGYVTIADQRVSIEKNLPDRW